MIRGASPEIQALLGTLFTWAVTALGSAVVFIVSGTQRKVLDGSLGFAAGVMTAASFWSLLAPAIEMAQTSKMYGSSGEYAFVPVAIGFFVGALFVYGADILLPLLGVSSSANISFALQNEPKLHKDGVDHGPNVTNNATIQNSIIESAGNYDGPVPYKRPLMSGQAIENISTTLPIHIMADQGNADQQPNNLTNRNIYQKYDDSKQDRTNASWRRILLLIIAITVHNIPEGLAVGVGFAAVNKSSSATFENARNLAIGIGIQNFPEGLAVSLPLKGAGLSVWKSFWYGQLSGMVEPIAGLLGALAVSVAEPLLPYAMSFAAGAMIYVVFDDILPEAQTCGNGKLASWSAVFGFIVMMSLDVGLG